MTGLLQMRGIEKSFGPTRALAGVDLEVAAGEVHGLVGENGAGKSTLMKVLAGVVRPDGGAITLAGAPFRPTGPVDALRAGVAMIYQELNLAPSLSVEDNLMLGREVTRGGLLDRRAMRGRVREALQWLDQEDLDPRRPVRTLGPGVRQLVEIARALIGDARVLVMDEPTSSLSRQDTERLFAVTRRLRDRGVAVIYISHFLDEVKRFTDRFTVLRDGRSVTGGDTASVRVEAMVESMVGRKVEDLFPQVPHERGAPLLEVRALAGDPLPRTATFTLHRGEILGIAGLVGAGRTELLRTLFGLTRRTAGAVHLATIAGALSPTPAASLRAGLGLLSEDRKQEGLALNLSIADNVTLSHLAPFTRGGLLRRSLRRSVVRRWMERLSIRARAPSQAVQELSGGNQQKVALARLLHHDVDVLLLDEPTRGIDVGSKAELYRWIGELAAAGKAVLFVSSYIPELLGVCDRIAVMHRGALGPARDAGECTAESILDEATRGAAA